MHHTIQALAEFYSDKNRSDAPLGYLYIAHTRHVLHHIMESFHLPVRELPKLDGSLEAMIAVHVQHMADVADALATNPYHTKVLTLKDAIQMVSLKEPIHIEPSDRVMPFGLARDVILDAPVPIAVTRCVCRPSAPESGAAEPDAECCMVVTEPFVSIAVDEGVGRRISPSEAVDIIDAAHARGAVHNAVFKKELGNRMYGMCNCNTWRCVPIRLWTAFQGLFPTVAPSGHICRADDGCTGCGLCVEACPFKAIKLAETADCVIIDGELCMGCGVCTVKCPEKVLRLERDPAKGDPLDVEGILRAMVDTPRPDPTPRPSSRDKLLGLLRPKK